MPSRRTHTKSRHGCDTCRRRRVKCDESDQPCGQCAARQLDCSYNRRDNGSITVPAPPLPPPPIATARIGNVEPPRAMSISQPASATESSGRSPRISESPGASTSATSLDQDIAQPPCRMGDRIRELELMRQWCLHSCKSLSRPESLDLKIWLGFATDLALKHNFLMDIILAISATQIATETKSHSARAFYTSLALEYQNSAVVAARKQLLDVSEDNCNALFSFTVLNIPTSVVLAQLPIGGQDTGRSPLESIVISSEWITCLVSLMTAGQHWLRQGPFHMAFDKCDDPSTYDDTMRPPMQRLTKILACSMYAGRDHVEQFRMFSHAVELLEEMFLRSRTMSIAWPAEIGEEFLRHLDGGNQMALLITMHWGVLIHKLDMWWASFTGKRLVEQISTELSSESISGDGRDAIQWARLQVGLDVQKTWV